MTRKIHYKAPSLQVEIIGAQIAGLIGSINHDEILPYLKTYQLDNIDPEKWYNMQMILDLLSDLVNAPGGMFDLVAIGLNSSIIRRIPPGTTDLKPVLKGLPQMIKSGFRNAPLDDLLTVEVEDEGPQHLDLNIYTVMPPDLLYGIFYGIARHIAGGTVLVQRTDVDDRNMRFHIHW